MKKITKKKISVTINEKIDNILNEEFNNKSKYIEWLIYQDLMKNSQNTKIKNILI